MPFVAARAPMPRTVIYQDDQGSETIREGGSRAWRNNNAGNIIKGTFAEEHGSIGADTRFAIFPDEATGINAVVALLSAPTYRNLALSAAINRYAPPNENNTAGYVAFVSQDTGIGPTRVLAGLSAAQLRSVALSIQRIEGWQPGSERPLLPSAGMVAGLALPVSSAAPAATDWMTVALAESKLPEHERSEWIGADSNPRILKYFEIAAPWFNAISEGGDEVDWCAAFVNYCLETAGYAGTNHPGARSFYWNQKHSFIKLDSPQFGAIAVFRDTPFADPQWKTGTGHVGFVVGWTETTIDILGGNQRHTVRREPFSYEYRKGNAVTRKIVAYMMPVMN